MQRRNATCIGAILAISLSASCATKQGTGAVAGAGVGGLAGHAIGGDVGMLIGAVAGAAVGSEIGRQLDEYDRQRAAYFLERNATNQTSTWVNPDTGYEYRVTPTDTYEREGEPCREFRMDTRIEGEWQEVEGVACRREDGAWQIVS